MDREEKALEAAIDALISRTQDVKNSLTSFLMKLETEYETINWPNVLDNFALLSGQVNTLMKILKNDKTPLLRNRVLLPLALSPERDEELVKLTENRVQAFSHEVVPDYLRTKLDPEVESVEQQILAKANLTPADAAQKQITSLNKICTNVIDLVKSARDAWESETGQRASVTQTSSMTDTNTLISAISLGKGLKPSTGPMNQASSQQGPIPQVQPSRSVSSGKAPSAVKTNIKAANTVHPYGR
ncbi:mediator of RNA polymerase II transcription subunit 8-B-like [Limulus polyphemus]|uniref:Mediator of RNA polymerase II transcription subunit 8 n=1 Tax=Limulus polyphemus TaxID=6850 RepID=A0ABM1BGR2_LIMPO|nr:mediator of RNA polymerase II transcription subunit 8-B-like [Limulus polyphemus]